MDVDTALLMPGQGGYRPGALAALPGAGELLATVDATAAEFGHGGVTAVLTAPDAPDPRDLAAADPMGLQLAIYASALAWAGAAGGAGADAVLGHSMGEVAAAVHAGYFTVADGARIVGHRARALARAAAAGGMLAVGLSAHRTRALVEAVERPGLQVAVVNAPRHTVVSGPEEALGVLAALTDALAVRAVRLPAPFPFHNPLLATARAEFAAAVAEVPQRPAGMLLYSPALGGFVTDQTDLKAVLVAQLTEPVDFLAALRDLQSHGLRAVVECGRAGLSQLVAAAVPGQTGTVERWLDGQTGRPAPPPPVVPPVAAPPPAAEPARPEPVPPVTGTVPAAVLQTLQRTYATHLGYPIEAMEPDADLEGDLGIGSLKHMEILATLVDQFGLHHAFDDSRFALAPTLAELARLIGEVNGGGRVGAERSADA